MREIEVIKDPLLGKKLGKGETLNQFDMYPYPYEFWSNQNVYLMLDGASWVFVTFKLDKKVPINLNQAGINVYRPNVWFGMSLGLAVRHTCYPGERGQRPEYISGEVTEYGVRDTDQNGSNKGPVTLIHLQAGNNPTDRYNKALIVYHPENGIISG